MNCHLRPTAAKQFLANCSPTHFADTIPPTVQTSSSLPLPGPDVIELGHGLRSKLPHFCLSRLIAELPQWPAHTFPLGRKRSPNRRLRPRRLDSGVQDLRTSKST